MNQFFKPTVGKIIFTIVLLVVEVFSIFVSMFSGFGEIGPIQQFFNSINFVFYLNLFRIFMSAGPNWTYIVVSIIYLFLNIYIVVCILSGLINVIKKKESFAPVLSVVVVYAVLLTGINITSEIIGQNNARKRIELRQYLAKLNSEEECVSAGFIWIGKYCGVEGD